ncbi:hypothetical protein WJX82_003851 [Trebouxia sp. C0006]
MYFDLPSAGNKVFVGGLSGVTHRDLYDGFSWFGPIANVKIVTDHYTGGPRGFGCPSVTKPPVSFTSSAKATASALLDIIHQAPRLLEMLPQDSLKALSATSRTLRAAVHDMTTVLTIEHEADIACLLKGHWPHLGLVIMRTQEYGYSSFFLLQPLQHPQLMGHDKNRFYAQPLRHLLGKDWSGLRRLDLTQVKSSSMGLAVVAQLSQGDWPLLTSLDLSDNKLGADSMLEVIKGKFPALESLDVSSNKLDVEAMRQLVKGDWPTLMYLWLSINPLLNAEGIQQLSHAKWGRLAAA